ncbi:MAG: hypothetical protein ACLFQM_12710 [Fidelibacterota bacterium]
MLREIIKVKNAEYTIHIPEEYFGREVEILIRPYLENTVCEEEVRYWQKVGRKSLEKIWDNDEDEVYSELL